MNKFKSFIIVLNLNYLIIETLLYQRCFLFIKKSIIAKFQIFTKAILCSFINLFILILLFNSIVLYFFKVNLYNFILLIQLHLKVLQFTRLYLL